MSFLKEFSDSLRIASVNTSGAMSEETSESVIRVLTDDEKMESELANCLNLLMLYEYRENFILMEIEFADLPTLTESTLKELIPDVIPRLRFVKFIERNFLQKKKIDNGWEIDSSKVKVFDSEVVQSGGFGQIVKGEISIGDSKMEIACKRVVVDGISVKKESVINETKVTSMCHHPNVLKCYGAFFSENEKLATIVLEYCAEGDLLEFSDQYHVPDLLKVNYFIEIAKGLLYLHSRNIVHRDIKPTNILVCDDKKTLKICDFGLSKISKKVTGTFVGTGVYLAPEVFFGDKIEDPTKIDIFSFGVLMWEMMTEEQAFIGLQRKYITSPVKLLMEIHGDPMLRKYSRPNILHKKLQGVPEGLRDIIELCWEQNAEDRPAALTVLEELLSVQKEMIRKAVGGAKGNDSSDDEDDDGSGTDEDSLF